MRKTLLAVAVVAAALTTAAPAVANTGAWLTDAEVHALPSAPTNAVPSSDVPVENQDTNADIDLLGAAIRAKHNGDAALTSAVRSRVKSTTARAKTVSTRALALGRNMQAVIVAGDLVDLDQDAGWKADVKAVLNRSTTEAGSPIECHHNRPNNWGTHCGAADLLGARVIGDDALFRTEANVWRGWLGNRSAYAGFNYGDLTWQANTAAPVGVDPKGATKSGANIDGVLPDDQRRPESCTTNTLSNPCNQNYVYEALQGAMVAMTVLTRSQSLLDPTWGDPRSWSDRALERAYRWEYNVNGFPAASDDTGFLNLATYLGFTNTNGKPFAGATDAHGKGMGFMGLTFGGRTYDGSTQPPPPPPADTDGDGVPDSTDACPTVAGPASNNGCPVATPPPADTDGDGVPDSTDQCPTVAGPASNGGCPVTQPTTTVTVKPDAADTYVSSATPTTTHGTDALLAVQNSASNQDEAWIKFTVPSTVGAVQSAKLRLNAACANSTTNTTCAGTGFVDQNNGVHVLHPATCPAAVSGLTWNTTSGIARSGNDGVGIIKYGYNDVALSGENLSAIKAGTDVCFVLNRASLTPDKVSFFTKDTATKQPELVVSY